MPKILHISRDNKFLDFAIDCFEKVNTGENYYLIVKNGSQSDSIVHIKYQAIVAETLEDTIELIQSESFISQYRAVVFHSLSSTEQIVLRAIKSSIKVIWIGYGFDYYPLVDFYMQKYLGKRTRGFWLREKPVLSRIGMKINGFFPIWSYLKSLRQLQRLNRVDYFAPVLEIEYHEVKNRHSWFRAQFLDWNYELAPEIFRNIGDSFIQGTNFMVGNSVSITNNHLECFDLITVDRLAERKVLVPLSYGFPLYFKGIIKAEGERLFGSQFEPMEEFVPFDVYLSKLRSCGFALFGSVRQQALGNIYMGLALGIKIYLHPKNPILQELKSKGFHIYDFDDFIREKSFDYPLALPLQKENRALMRGMALEENYLKKTQDLVKLVESFE